MKRLITTSVSVVMVFAGAHFAAGQELGEASAGCHAVQRGGLASPNEKAPPFEAIANTRGMTEMALRVWFQTPHPTMPNLMMTARQKDDVISYILSLKEPR